MGGRGRADKILGQGDVSNKLEIDTLRNFAGGDARRCCALAGHGAVSLPWNRLR